MICMQNIYFLIKELILLLDFLLVKGELSELS